jgi:hypothetical protein
VAGLERWSDYIPVKLVQGGPENSYSGTIDVAVIPSLTANTQAWKEYIPVYADDSATDAWTVNNIGYIPYNYALFNDAAMQLDLTNGAALDPRITFSRTTNATVTGSNGLIQYAPHNLLTFSEQFDNAAWSKTRSTISANTTISPNGTLTADTLTSDSTQTNGSWVRFVLTAFSGSHNLSIYAKEGTSPFFNVRLDGIGGVIFNLSNGTIKQQTGATGLIQSVGDGWYRCSIQVTASASTVILYMVGNASMTTSTWATTIGDSVNIWGAQLEAGAYATTYIPTTTAAVTRVADIFTRTNVYTNNFITAAGGTWFVDLSNNLSLIRDNSSGGLWIGDNSSLSSVSNGFTLRHLGGTTALRVVKILSGAGTSIYTTNTDNCKIAIRWNDTTAAVFVNGSKVVTATPFTTTNMEFLANMSNQVPYYFNQSALFPVPMTDAQLAEITKL